MTNEGGAAFQTSLDDLFALPAGDDAGAETAARYRFQAEVLARDAIRCLAAGRGAVICEWQEDAIVVWADDDVELVSVKHREASQGAWSPRLLIESGGLRHLYERWTVAKGRARCRLATNGGLDMQARAIQAACAGGEDAAIGKVAGEICTRMGAPADELKPFLKVLRIQDGLPARSHIGTVNIAKIMRPALRRMGITSATPEAAYAAIVSEVELASRDRPDSLADSLEVVLDPRNLDALVQTRRRLADRTLRPDRLRRAVAAARGSERVRLVAEGAPRTTALEQKLRAGGLGETAVRAAQALRASWSILEATFHDSLGGAEELDDFAVRLRMLAADAETDALSNPATDGTWGRQMRQTICNRISVGVPGAPPFIPDDPAVIEGYVYELTDRCLIWWSRQFEIAKAS